MSPMSVPRPTIAAWWQTWSMPRSASSTAAGSRTSPYAVLGVRVAVGRSGGVGGGMEVVEHADVVPAGDERVDDVRADEAVAAGDEDVAHPRAIPATRRARGQLRFAGAPGHAAATGGDPLLFQREQPGLSPVIAGAARAREGRLTTGIAPPPGAPTRGRAGRRATLAARAAPQSRAAARARTAARCARSRRATAPRAPRRGARRARCRAGSRRAASRSVAMPANAAGPSASANAAGEITRKSR